MIIREQERTIIIETSSISKSFYKSDLYSLYSKKADTAILFTVDGWVSVASFNADDGHTFYDYSGVEIPYNNAKDIALILADFVDEAKGGSGGEGVAPQEITQIVNVTDATASDPLALNGDTSIVEVILDASMTVDWKPSSITGWIKGRSYIFEIVKNANIGIDLSDARAAITVGYDDDIDPFASLEYINLTQKRACITAYGYPNNFGQFGRLIMTDSNYVE